ncbi:hypothetical protein CHS0354_003405 [Potamilus streckersoni]|uniref:Uncharacterized protein n=1 Tax=Potamilus streckersoni TaxID=2493646 RepID=A0AAE0SPH6_9BIVA|nr:hypothetical protein CHS0354_003405 [Potamilus streckersoni]
MQPYLALLVIGLFLWENCIATCPDGSTNTLVCDPFVPFQCPVGYMCINQGDNNGMCCLEPAYSCPRGFPIGYGNSFGLRRCNGLPCPFTYYCKAVEPAVVIPGVCCPHLF